LQGGCVFRKWLAILLMLAAASACSTLQKVAGGSPASDWLRPGQYVWQPERAPVGPVEVVVSLGSQRAYVYRAGTLIGTSTVSSGRRGSETPVGRFEILQKRRTHRSNRYSNAPMPFMQRLNWYGVALHGGTVPGYAASHGCIRLPMKFAEALYGATQLGGFVFVARQALPSPERALKLARANANAPMSADRRRRGP
jgi:L,D-transpeptidase catalytic domain